MKQKKKTAMTFRSCYKKSYYKYCKKKLEGKACFDSTRYFSLDAKNSNKIRHYYSAEQMLGNRLNRLSP